MSLIALNSLKKVYKPSMRVARGPGSGKGCTAGRGIKGQKSRSGVSVRKLYGVTGQNNIYRSLPIFGFNSHQQRFGDEMFYVTIERIMGLVTNGKLNAEKISISDLAVAGAVHPSARKVKVLMGKNASFLPSVKLCLEVSAASSAVKKCIQDAGGSVVSVCLRRTVASTTAAKNSTKKVIKK